MSAKRPTIRLLHTADIHIGDDYEPARRLKGLVAVVDTAQSHGVDALLIAGDLFDNPRVTQRDIDDALTQLTRLSIPTFISNGNHDVLEEASVYHRVLNACKESHLLFFNNPKGQSKKIEKLSLSVWSRAMVDHIPQHSPLAGYTPEGEGMWRIVLAHGHYTPDNGGSPRSSPILRSEIENLGCDYLALGHWHRFKDVSSKETPAFYPDSPSENIGNPPSANLIVLDAEQGVRVERLTLVS